MRVLFDTNVLLATLLTHHQHHSRGQSAFLKHVSNPNDVCMISLHTLAELYCNLSRMPSVPAMSPATVWNIIEGSILKKCKTITLAEADAVQLLRNLAILGIRGAATYDALICACAEKAGADALYTFNTRDFLRVWPAGTTKIIEP